MTLERYQKSKELFQECLERPAPERESFLARACGDDIELRKGVESLLAFSANENSFFDPSHLPTLELKEPVEEPGGATSASLFPMRLCASGNTTS